MILVGGTQRTGSGSSATGADFAVVCFLPDGSIDTSFGNNGTSLTSFSSGTSANNTDFATSAVTSDGRLVVLGRTHNGGGSGEDMALVRFSQGQTPSNRTYARQDANFNTTSTILLTGATTTSGVLTTSAERYEYTPYGEVTVLTGPSTGGTFLNVVVELEGELREEPGLPIDTDFVVKGEGAQSSDRNWKYLFQGGQVDSALGASGLYHFNIGGLGREYDPVQGRSGQENRAMHVGQTNSQRASPPVTPAAGRADGTPWTSGSFVDHFYIEHSLGVPPGDVDLAKVGLLDKYRSHSSVEKVVSDARARAAYAALSLINSLNCPSPTSGTITYIGRGFTDVTDTIYSVGKSMLSYQVTITASISCKCGKPSDYTFLINIHFYIRDRFVDPLPDGLPQMNFGGTPYGINADWNESISGAREI